MTETTPSPGILERVRVRAQASADRTLEKRTRFLARCQRHPWRTGLVLAALAVAYALVLDATQIVALPPMAAGACAGGLVVALTMHVFMHAWSRFDRIVPVALVGAALIGWSGVHQPAALLVLYTPDRAAFVVDPATGRELSSPLLAYGAATALGIALPLLSQWMLPLWRMRRAVPVALVVGAAAVLAPRTGWLPPAIVSVLCILVAFEVSTRLTPAGFPAFIAIVLGVISGFLAEDPEAGTYTSLPNVPLRRHLDVTPVLTHALVGVFVAAAAAHAQLGRWICAVPLEHAIFEDFGPLRRGAAKREAAA